MPKIAVNGRGTSMARRKSSGASVTSSYSPKVLHPPGALPARTHTGDGILLHDSDSDWR